MPDLSPTEPITVTAQAGNQWQLGAYDVWILRGDCTIQQGNGYARSREAVLWIDRAETAQQRPHKVIAYLEGDVEVRWDRRPNSPRLTDQTWFGRFFSSAGVEVRAGTTAGKPDVLPPVYWRGMEQRTPESADRDWRTHAQQTQFMALAPALSATPETPPAPAGSATLPPLTPAAPLTPVAPAAPAAPGAPLAPVPAMSGPTASPAGVRQIRVFARSDVPPQVDVRECAPNSNQWIAVITSGVTILVDTSTTVPGIGQVGTLDISADRLVIWTAGLQAPSLKDRIVQDQRTPLEFYMEGNIVFRQGERTITAERMYYDVTNHVGTVLNADMLTPFPNYQGLKVRLHAEVLQQTAQDRYFAQNAFLTSSRMGEPSYRLQAGDVYFEDIQHPVIDPLTGQPLVNPETHEQVFEHQRLATGANNFLFLGPVPIFYWPILATDLNDPAYYIRNVQIRQDNVYGTQILTKWNGYDLLGVRDKPKGTDFGISLDYLNIRGFGYGASFNYDREGMFGIPGHVAGVDDFWGIQDHGVDDLGQGRLAVPLEASYRYRLFAQHRELLPYNLQLSAELGVISDRNFLEEYYKNEWDELKDQTTGVELKQINENSSWSIAADYRVNDFFTDTNWLPRGDHYWIGQSLFRDAFTWYEHSSLAYAEFRPTNVPQNVTKFPSPPSPVGPAGPFNFLPWEANSVQGERFATRQEIDWPFQIGPVKVVPYALGDAAHWGEDINGNSLDRLFWQGGVRASLPMWSVDPTFSSDLFNVHGIAHKVVFNAEFSYAQANQDFENLPLYDPLDDNSVEAFRRRFLTTTFGIPSMSPLPAPPGTPWIPRFDERLYALRTGLQDWVTSPSTEIAGDLTAIRLGAEQRWQTKRGPENDRHIIDWITLDTNVTLFPDPNRDNFGTVPGLLDYDFRWHVGDRLTLVSNGIFDFFNEGQKIISVGGFLNRPPRGSLYAGFTIIEGPIDSKILSLSYSYWMSPKWLSSFGTTIDFGTQGNIGQNFSITRVGESFLISAGFNVDASRNSVGASLAIEPRFFPKTRLGNVGGAQIPPAGALGLE